MTSNLGLTSKQHYAKLNLIFFHLLNKGNVNCPQTAYVPIFEKMTQNYGWRTCQPWTFQPHASTPDLSTPDFSTMNFWTLKKSSWLKSLGLKLSGLKCHLPRRLKDISNPDFLSPDFTTINFSIPWFKNSCLKSLGLKNSWLKSLGLEGPGLKLGVSKSGVEMSFYRLV